MVKGVPHADVLRRRDTMDELLVLAYTTIK
jgi:hypothetical protein